MLEIARRLHALKASWQGLEVAPHNLAAIGLPEKESRFIEDLIDGLAGMASELNASPIGSLAMVHRSCEDQLRHLEAFFSTPTTENPTFRMLGFVTLLLQMQSILKGALAQAPDPPDNRNPSQKIA